MFDPGSDTYPPRLSAAEMCAFAAALAAQCTPMTGSRCCSCQPHMHITFPAVPEDDDDADLGLALPEPDYRGKPWAHLPPTSFIGD